MAKTEKQFIKAIFGAASAIHGQRPGWQELFGDAQERSDFAFDVVLRLESEPGDIPRLFNSSLELEDYEAIGNLIGTWISGGKIELSERGKRLVKAQVKELENRLAELAVTEAYEDDPEIADRSKRPGMELAPDPLVTQAEQEAASSRASYLLRCICDLHPNLQRITLSLYMSDLVKIKQSEQVSLQNAKRTLDRKDIPANKRTEADLSSMSEEDKGYFDLKRYLIAKGNVDCLTKLSRLPPQRPQANQAARVRLMIEMCIANYVAEDFKEKATWRNPRRRQRR
jgi:hypothetical protein